MRSIKPITLPLILCIVATLFAEQQISLRGGMTKELDALSSATGKVEDMIFQGDLSYHGVIPITDRLSLRSNLTSQILPGAETNKSSYYANRTYPYLVDGNIAGRIRSDHQEAMILLEGDITPKAKVISFPTSVPSADLASASLTHRGGFGSGLTYSLLTDHFTGTVDGLYREGSFKLTPADSAAQSQSYNEGDLYYRGSVHAEFLDHQIYSGISLFNKDDLNSFNGFDRRMTSLEAGTALIFNKRKTQIYSRLALSQLEGDMIRENGFTTGIGQEGYLRVSQKLKRNFWLKGDVDYSSRDNLSHKARLGGSVKKAWGTSTLEGGYWATPGSLFPRQTAWASGDVRLIDQHLELEPSVTNYWIQKDTHFDYYRTDLGMQINVRPFEDLRKATVSAGGLWRNLKDSPQFVSGFELFFGLETVL